MSDKLLAVGSREVDKYNTHAELYDFDTNKWIVVQDYPFIPLADGGFGYYDMVYVDSLSAFIVIGGYDTDYQNLAKIAMFHDDTWSPLGQLNTPRRVRVNSFFRLINCMQQGHQVQWINDTLIVAGGMADSSMKLSTEVCRFNGTMFACDDIEPYLGDYYQGVSFAVGDSYCPR